MSLVTEIISQPDGDSINAAYRPVILRVRATSSSSPANLPPVVYCDIYFDDTFACTISKTQYEILNDDDSEWQFDLQNPAQDFLSWYLPANGGTLENAAPLIVKASCMLRGSGIDADGFILQEGTPPVQATSDSDPVAGDGGIVSNDFYIVNASLQHENNQDLATHLSAYKTGTWGSTTYPLTHRPSLLMGREDSDHFPVLTDQEITSLTLHYKLPGDTDFRTETAGGGGGGGCGAAITEISIVVTGDSVDVTWTSTGAVSFNWKIDGGADTNTADEEFTASGLSLGAHTLTITPLCDSGSGTPASADFTVEADCVDVTITDGQTLPDGTFGTPYSEVIDLSGTAPFTLGATTKPSWMTIAISGSTITFSGTPDADGLTVAVSAAVTNCSSGSATFAQDIAVIKTPALSGDNSLSYSNGGGWSPGGVDNVDCVITGTPGATVIISMSLSSSNPGSSAHFGFDNGDSSVDLSGTSDSDSFTTVFPPDGTIGVTITGDTPTGSTTFYGASVSASNS